jgi:hypothetical protein
VALFEVTVRNRDGLPDEISRILLNKVRE